MHLEIEDIPTTETPPEEPPSKKCASLPRWVVFAVCISLLTAITAFTIPYIVLSRRVDQRLASGTFQHASNYYSAPAILSLGDPMPDAELVGALKRSGYSVTETGTAITLHSNAPVEVQFARVRRHPAMFVVDAAKPEVERLLVGLDGHAVSIGNRADDCRLRLSTAIAAAHRPADNPE